jgi:hypothetical protein
MTLQEIVDQIWAYSSRTTDGQSAPASDNTYLDDIRYAVWTHSSRTVEGATNHALTATGMTTGSPVFGAPVLTAQSANHDLTATGITTGQPTSGTPAATINRVLSASGIATGSPVVGSPAMFTNHVLSAFGITIGAPAPGHPAMGQAHVMAAMGIVAGLPVLDPAIIAQAHVISAIGILAGQWYVGKPDLNGVSPILPGVAAVDFQWRELEIAYIGRTTGDQAAGQIGSLTATGGIIFPEIASAIVELQASGRTAQVAIEGDA